MITQHEKAVAAKFNDLVSPQDSGNDRREPSPISCLPTTHVCHRHTYTLECKLTCCFYNKYYYCFIKSYRFYKKQH